MCRLGAHTMPLAVLALCLISSGCQVAFGPAIKGSGNRVVEQRQTESFSRVAVAVPGQFQIDAGGPPEVILEVDDNLQKVIETSVKGDRLRIRNSQNFRSDDGVIAQISTSNLEGVSIAGSGDVILTNVQSAKLQLDIAGSGSIRGDGLAERIDIDIAGSGDIDLRDLKATEIYVSIAGSGNVIVHALQKLDVDIAGSGEVIYYGNPEDVKQSVAGSGEVMRASPVESLPQPE